MLYKKAPYKYLGFKMSLSFKHRWAKPNSHSHSVGSIFVSIRAPLHLLRAGYTLSKFQLVPDESVKNCSVGGPVSCLQLTFFDWKIEGNGGKLLAKQCLHPIRCRCCSGILTVDRDQLSKYKSYNGRFVNPCCVAWMVECVRFFYVQPVG